LKDAACPEKLSPYSDLVLGITFNLLNALHTRKDRLPGPIEERPLPREFAHHEIDGQLVWHPKPNDAGQGILWIPLTHLHGDSLRLKARPGPAIEARSLDTQEVEVDRRSDYAVDAQGGGTDQGIGHPCFGQNPGLETDLSQGEDSP